MKQSAARHVEAVLFNRESYYPAYLGISPLSLNKSSIFVSDRFRRHFDFDTQNAVYEQYNQRAS